LMMMRRMTKTNIGYLKMTPFGALKIINLSILLPLHSLMFFLFISVLFFCKTEIVQRNPGKSFFFFPVGSSTTSQQMKWNLWKNINGTPTEKRKLKLNARRDYNNSLAVTTMALQHHHNCKKKNLWKKRKKKAHLGQLGLGVPCKSKNMVVYPSRVRTWWCTPEE
jgi:hypothetical protein